MHDEKKLIRLAMITLFLSLMIVYMLLYQVKGDKLKVESSRGQTGKNIAITSKTGTISSVKISENKPSGSSQITINQKTGNDSNSTSTQTNIKIKTLSGTNVYYGESKIVDKLGIKYQYALKDSKNIYFFNLGNPTYDFRSIAKSLGGDTFTLITEQEIYQNKLFGNKITFINLPENKDKLVLLVIYIKSEVRLIQISYDIYHQSKNYLKNLFID